MLPQPTGMAGVSWGPYQTYSSMPHNCYFCPFCPVAVMTILLLTADPELPYFSVPCLNCIKVKPLLITDWPAYQWELCCICTAEKTCSKVFIGRPYVEEYCYTLETDCSPEQNKTWRNSHYSHNHIYIAKSPTRLSNEAKPCPIFWQSVGSEAMCPYQKDGIWPATALGVSMG